MLFLLPMCGRCRLAVRCSRQRIVLFVQTISSSSQNFRRTSKSSLIGSASDSSDPGEFHDAILCANGVHSGVVSSSLITGLPAKESQLHMTSEDEARTGTSPHPTGISELQVNVSTGPVQLSIVLPTYNERENIPELLCRLANALRGLQWEAIFVDDDSPDGTAETVRTFAREDPRIRLLHRIGRRGLSSACIEGILASSADWVAVMDADMQHDERVLPRMLALARQQQLDLVVGTRNAAGGSMGDFARGRVLLSRLGQRISHAVCKCHVSDPMSGFFVARRSFVLACAPRLQTGGFKVLLDLFASSQNPVRFAEVGYTFRCRQHGKSKLDVNTAVEYFALVVHKLTRDLVPAHFVLFALVGAAGVAIHLASLDLLVSYRHEPFSQAQVLATYIAMTANFFFNNVITYRDRSLHGLRLLRGLLSFWLVCSFGAWASVVFARALLGSGARWWVAGLAGLALSSGWNYSMSNLFTWQAPRKSPQEKAMEPHGVTLPG